MASMVEVRERQKNHLYTLLKIKGQNRNIEVKGLQDAILSAIVPMEHEDIAWVEKITGVKAIA